MVRGSRSTLAPSGSLRGGRDSRDPNRLLRSPPRSIKAVGPSLPGELCLSVVRRVLADANPHPALRDGTGDIPLASTVRYWMQRSALDVCHRIPSAAASHDHRNFAGVE